MSAWKVILATLVIYATGVFTGAIVMRWMPKPSKPPSPIVEQPPPPSLMRDELVRRMAAELKLSPAQKERIHRIVRESQERVKELYGLIGPEVRDEMQYVREAIRAELTPEQTQAYDEFMRKRQRRMSEGRPDGSRQRAPRGASPTNSRGGKVSAERSKPPPQGGTQPKAPRDQRKRQTATNSAAAVPDQPVPPPQ